MHLNFIIQLIQKYGGGKQNWSKTVKNNNVYKSRRILYFRKHAYNLLLFHLN